MSNDLLTALAEILGIPIASIVAITFIKLATGGRPFAPDMGAEVGMDLSILAAGACGSLFANQTLVSKWPHGLTVYGIFVFALCILMVAVLSYIRRWQERKLPITIGRAVRNVILGALPLCLIASILILGYN